MKIRILLMIAYLLFSGVYILLSLWIYLDRTVYQAGVSDGMGTAVQQLIVLSEQKPCEEIVVQVQQKQVKLIESGCLEKKNEEKKQPQP